MVDNDESASILPLLRELEGTTSPRRTIPASESVTLASRDAGPLCVGLSCFRQGVVVRHLFALLGFDEHAPFRFRLDHKLVQSLVLKHYAPEAIPDSCGLTRSARRATAKNARSYFAQSFPNGFFIKPTLGYASYEHGHADRADDAFRLLAELEGSGNEQGSCQLIDEEFLVQERIPIADEFRVHSFEDSVIQDLTSRRFHPGSIGEQRVALNRFVQSILDALPSGLTRNTMCGWDIAITPSGRYWVLEVNYAGWHPVFAPGFQCSGFLVDPLWGPSNVAKLLLHVEQVYERRVEIVANGGDPDTCELYATIAYWIDLRRLGSSLIRLAEDVQNEFGSEDEHSHCANKWEDPRLWQWHLLYSLNTFLPAVKKVLE